MVDRYTLDRLALRKPPLVHGYTDKAKRVTSRPCIRSLFLPRPSLNNDALICYFFSFQVRHQLGRPARVASRVPAAIRSNAVRFAQHCCATAGRPRRQNIRAAAARSDHCRRDQRVSQLILHREAVNGRLKRRLAGRGRRDGPYQSRANRDLPEKTAQSKVVVGRMLTAPATKAPNSKDSPATWPTHAATSAMNRSTNRGVTSVMAASFATFRPEGSAENVAWSPATRRASRSSKATRSIENA